MTVNQSTSQVLRHATAASHARVDDCVRAVLAQGEHGRLAFLRASADMVVPWEIELQRFEWPERVLIAERLRKSAWLVEDLGATSYPARAVRAHASNQFEAWGALYVLEGSTLGATAIRRILQPGTARYLEGYGDDTRAMWERMRAALDEEVPGGEARDACVAGALRVFSDFEATLQHHV